MGSFYLTVYDAAQVRACDPGMAVISGFLLLAAAATLIASRRGLWSTDENRRRARLFAFAGVAGAVMFFLAGVLQAAAVRRPQLALETGRYERVAGRIENFVPGDRGGHKEESFTVTSGGRVYTYAYTYSVLVPGFHRSAGPIGAGMEVRIADVDGYIARLEIK